jgi:hypothetical protein
MFFFLNIKYLFYRVDNSIKNVYFNKINMAHATTIDWNQEPHNNIVGIVNTIAEDIQW